jgi:hypothetical protein
MFGTLAPEAKREADWRAAVSGSVAYPVTVLSRRGHR